LEGQDWQAVPLPMTPSPQNKGDFKQALWFKSENCPKGQSMQVSLSSLEIFPSGQAWQVFLEEFPNVPCSHSEIPMQDLLENETK